MTNCGFGKCHKLSPGGWVSEREILLLQRVKLRSLKIVRLILSARARLLIGRPHLVVSLAEDRGAHQYYNIQHDEKTQDDVLVESEVICLLLR